MMEIIETVFEWYLGHMNYFTVGLLMVIESSFIPFPSEIVIPVAAYKAAQGDLNIYLVVVAGTIGALIGAMVNYVIGYYVGRPVIHKLANSKFGRMMLLSEEKVVQAEDYFVKNGKISTLIGRLVPGIRQLISIPAGMAKMNLRDFLLYTTIGAGAWNIILAVIGYFLYEKREQIYPYLTEIMLVLGALFIIYLYVQTRKNRRKK
jgi:membrane protein DedA with SNARE-associated domain